MADILEDAIADAERLQKAAKQSAESSILEKHHKEVKEESDRILSEEEEGMLGDEEGEGEELDFGDEEFDFEEDDEEFGFEGDDSGLDTQVPDASADGEDLCPCPEEDEEIEINFDELAQQIENGESAEDHGEAAEEVVGDEDEMLDEEVEIDMEPTKSGTTERPTKELDRELDKNPPEDADLEDEESDDEEDSDISDAEKATGQIDKSQLEELKRKNQYLKKELENVKEGHKSLKEERNELRSKLLDTSKKLKESNMQRAKFFYKSCVLENSSLNERQKRKLAETLEDAESAEQAKVIYESVNKALMKETDHKKPKKGEETLNEAIDSSMPNESLRVKGNETQKETSKDLINENVKRKWSEIANISSDKDNNNNDNNSF